MRFLRGIICLFFVTVSIIGVSAMSGSGDLASQERELPAFHSIELEGSGNVFLTQGDTQYLKIITDENIIDKLKTKVNDGVLRIFFDSSIINYTKLDIHITIPEIKALEVEGSGDFIGQNLLKLENLSLDIAGSGDIKLEVEAKDIEIDIAGSGDIELKGTAVGLDIDVAGSGDVEARKLEAKSSNVEIAGSGEAIVNASDVLSVEIMGSGDVYYKGSPQLDVDISGSGSVKRIKK